MCWHKALYACDGFGGYRWNRTWRGEAVFVDDIPSPPNCLHGAYVYSEKPLARITSIKLRQELELDGVKGIISSKDILNGRVNLGAKIIFGSEPLFSKEIAQCVGDRLAFVVADTQKLAEFAANSAFVEYSIENLEPPILSVEDAVKKSRFFDVPPSYQPKNQIGDITKALAEADHKIVSSKRLLISLNELEKLKPLAQQKINELKSFLVGPTSKPSPSQGHLDHARVHPKFLHSNATSHKWVSEV